MSLHVVATVENSHNLSCHDFIDKFESDPWGKYIQFSDKSLSLSWDMFPWQGKSYFVWTCSPRVDYLGIYSHVNLWDEDIWAGEKLPERHVRRDYPMHLTFLKVMLAVERIAGGPVYVGEEMGYAYTPGGLKDTEYIYELPGELDIFIPKWRGVEVIEIEEPCLLF